MFLLKRCKLMVAARRRLEIDRDSPTVSRTKHLSTHRWQGRRKTRATAFPVSPRSAPLTLRPRVGNDATDKKGKVQPCLVLIMSPRKAHSDYYRSQACVVTAPPSFLGPFTNGKYATSHVRHAHVGVKISTPTSAEDLFIATTILGLVLF